MTINVNLICEHPSDACDCSTGGEECCCIPEDPASQETVCCRCGRHMYEIEWDTGERVDA